MTYGHLFNILKQEIDHLGLIYIYHNLSSKNFFFSFIKAETGI